ncbi:hypothetical protein BTR23_04110 [Alkalihalophilus pseudofirmus]|nr:hypothetical protein BTR23_04110 [Alkalihalophilus pseudofirmus]
MDILNKVSAISYPKWFIATLTTAFLTIVLGFIGYMPLLDYHILNSLYYTVRLFFGNFDAPMTGYSIALEFARWLALFTVFSSIILAGFVVFQEHIKLLRLSRIAKHHVICGLNKYSVQLAKDLLERHHQVVVIEKDSTNPYLSVVKSNGGSIFIGDPRNDRILEQARIHTCSFLTIFTDNDTDNLEICLHVQDLLDQSKYKNANTKVMIHLFEKELEPVIDKLDAIIDRKVIDLQIFNIYEHKAKLLFEDYPLYKLEQKNTLHLLIVGFDQLGENVLLQACKIAHFGNRKKLKISVVDKEVKEKKSWFKARYPKMNKVAEIEFIEVDMKDNAFYEMLANQYFSVNYIAVCLEDEQQALIRSLLLMKTYKDTPIVVNISEDINLADWINGNRDKFENIYRFGAINEIASTSVIIDEELDNIAKVIHKEYCLSANKNISWHSLSIFGRGSNRAQADHIDTKLALMGLIKEKTSLDTQGGLTLDDYLSVVDNHLERLAEAEHDRWNAYHFINGWDVCPPEVNRDEDKKLHPCLVGWDELDHVCKVKETPYKDYDRDTVRKLYGILKKCGYVIKEK